MLKKTLAASAMGILLLVLASPTHAAGSSELAAGQLCATKLFVAARGKSPSVLLRMSERLVDFDQVMKTAAKINGDTLTPTVKATYRKGMKEFAAHTMPQLTAKLQQRPVITAVSAEDNVLTILDNSGVVLIVQKESCRILDAKSALLGSLTGQVARFIKENNFS
jgi:hypothetical protein